MSGEVLALVYEFLKKKDQTCAEIFKRGSNLNVICAKDLPCLEEIVDFYIKSKKKEASKSSDVKISNMNATKLESMMQMGKTKSCDLLTQIVHKRNSDSIIIDTDTDSNTETDGEITQNSSDSEQEVMKKETKRRRVSDGVQKVWPAEKDVNKKKKKKMEKNSLDSEKSETRKKKGKK